MTSNPADSFSEGMNNSEELPFPETDCALIESINKFDERRGQLYDWLSSVAVDLPEVAEYHDATSQLITETAEVFVECFREVRRSSDNTDDAKDEIAKIWRTDDTERVKLFCSLVDCNCFDPFDEERMEVVINDLYDSIESEADLDENTYEIFRAALSGDVEMFAQHIEQKRENEPKVVSTTEITIDLDNSKLAKHAVDIAKIALGVSLGIIMSKRLQK